MLKQINPYGWMVVDDRTLLPRYWAAVWCMTDLNGRASSTTNELLHGVDALYRHSDQTFGYGALDDALTDLDLVTLSQVLEAFFFKLKNGNSTEAVDIRWSAATRFVRETAVSLDQTFDAESLLNAIDARFARLERLQSGLRIGRQAQGAPIRALPAAVVEDLYEILAPDSKRSPFKMPSTRWRAYVVFVLLLHQGLRQGEALILPASAVKAEHNGDGRIIHWLDVRGTDDDEFDPRYHKPSIKNVQSIRQIPVTSSTAKSLKCYRTEWRGRQPHSFFLASKNKRPLSKEGLAKYLRQASLALSKSAQKTLYNRTRESVITPHDLRHTCATYRMRQLLDLGMSASEASQQLRSFFGWSMDSDMPRHYAKAAFEDRLVRVWGDQFDQRAAVLRALPE